MLKTYQPSSWKHLLIWQKSLRRELCNVMLELLIWMSTHQDPTLFLLSQLKAQKLIKMERLTSKSVNLTSSILLVQNVKTRLEPLVTVLKKLQKLIWVCQLFAMWSVVLQIQNALTSHTETPDLPVYCKIHWEVILRLLWLLLLVLQITILKKPFQLSDMQRVLSKFKINHASMKIQKTLWSVSSMTKLLVLDNSWLKWQEVSCARKEVACRDSQDRVWISKDRFLSRIRKPWKRWKSKLSRKSDQSPRTSKSKKQL